MQVYIYVSKKVSKHVCMHVRMYVMYVWIVSDVCMQALFVYPSTSKNKNVSSITKVGLYKMMTNMYTVVLYNVNDDEWRLTDTAVITEK